MFVTNQGTDHPDQVERPTTFISPGDPLLSTLTQRELLVEVVARYGRNDTWRLGHYDMQRFIDAAADEAISSSFDPQTKAAIDDVLVALVKLHLWEQNDPFVC